MKKALTVILIFVLCGFASAGIAYGVGYGKSAAGLAQEPAEQPVEEPATEPKDETPKKAIIMLHSMLAGTLENADTGEIIWLPIEYDGVTLLDLIDNMLMSALDIILCDTSVGSKINAISEDDHNSVIYQMLCDENGNSIYNIQAVDFETNDTFQRYGILGAYRQMYEGLEELYGDDTDVIIYQYDWRLDNRLAAQKLEEFVNAKGYEEIVLLSHSNGGPVASSYLGRSAENREKVKLYCAYVAPFFGSSMALTTLENTDGLISYYVNLVSQLFSDKNFIEQIAKNQMKPLIQNTPILYQLLPTIEYFNTYYSSKGTQGSITVDGKRITTQEELFDFYCSRPWAYNSKGELKPMLTDYRAYVDSTYVTVDGKKVHSTELVNTYYFTNAGSGASDTQFVYEKGRMKYAYGLEGNGDSTVLYTSATIGKTKDDERVIFSEEYISHDYYGIDWSTVSEKTTELIDSVWG